MNDISSIGTISAKDLCKHEWETVPHYQDIYLGMRPSTVVCTCKYCGAEITAEEFRKVMEKNGEKCPLNIYEEDK